MKLSLSLALASVLGAAAQSINELPSCATSCATDSLPDSCSPIDVQCICSAGSFIQQMSCCVSKGCSKSDQEAALSYARKICHGAGVTDLPEHASCSGSDSSSGSGSGSGASATTSSGSSESTASSTSDSDSSESSAASSSGSSSQSSSSSSPSESSNAGAAVGQKDALAAVAGFAAFAILA